MTRILSLCAISFLCCFTALTARSLERSALVIAAFVGGAVWVLAAQACYKEFGNKET